MPGDIWLTFPDGTEHELKESVTIGRDAARDLTFQSPTVSREHAALTFREGRWFVEDRGSFNGTFLNGTRVQPGTPLPLRHADRIGIGDRHGQGGSATHLRKGGPVRPAGSREATSSLPATRLGLRKERGSRSSL